MPDAKTRRFVEQRDKAMARPHRLEPERLVLPDRQSAKRRVCASGCGFVISEQEWKYGRLDAPLDEAPPVFTTKCPRDGGELVLVEG